jgi:hypothetical protein
MIKGVELSRAFAVRVRGKSITWRVVVDGAAGEEVLDQGTIGAATATARATLPETLGGRHMRVEAKAATGTENVTVESTWVPILTIGGTHAVGLDGAGVARMARRE